MEIIVVGHAADVRDIILLHQKASGQAVLFIEELPERHHPEDRFDTFEIVNCYSGLADIETSHQPRVENKPMRFTRKGNRCPKRKVEIWQRPARCSIP